MSFEKRSNCPISFALDLIGDKWSLLVLRDILFMNKQYYHDFASSEEGISTNILADRLQKLESYSLLTKERDPENKKRYIYKPTSKGLDLLPLILEMVLWSAKHDPETGAPLSEIKKIKKDPTKYAQKIRFRFEK